MFDLSPQLDCADCSFELDRPRVVGGVVEKLRSVIPAIERRSRETTLPLSIATSKAKGTLASAWLGCPRC